MTFHPSRQCASQHGWITIEIVLALALLSVVMYVVQQQSNSQWQVIQHRQATTKLRDNIDKQKAMMLLTGSSSWMGKEKPDQQSGYPDCQRCAGADLVQWFQAAQSKTTTSVQIMVPDDG